MKEPLYIDYPANLNLPELLSIAESRGDTAIQVRHNSDRHARYHDIVTSWENCGRLFQADGGFLRDAVSIDEHALRVLKYMIDPAKKRIVIEVDDLFK